MKRAVVAVVLCLCACRASCDVTVYTNTLPHAITDEFLDLPASFGPELPSEGLRGFLVAGAPADGCSALAPPPPAEDNFTGKWIVLVARYNCNFDTKVRNAQAAGYDCAIVHNVNSSDLETMSTKNPEGIYIPSVFVSETSGLMLAQLFDYTKGYYVMVNGNLPFNINTHLLLPAAIVIVLCLVVILISMIVKCIRDRRRARRHCLPSRILKKIPTCKFSKGDPYETCAICLDDYQEGERLRVLPCAHAYHAKCVDPWLTQNRRVCPVCKRRVHCAAERRPPADHSDSDDTAPLVSPAAPPSGGTFGSGDGPVSSRRARLVAALRQAAARVAAHAQTHASDNTAHSTPSSSDTSPSDDENDQSNDENEENEGDGNDRRPLLPTSAVISERPRRPRARASSLPRAASPQPPPTLLHSAGHSINGEARGEIGVAALPASGVIPHPHINL